MTNQTLVAFDPNQYKVFGPTAPWLVGLALGLCLYGGGFMAPGYTGPALTAWRCIGPGIVILGWQSYYWVYILGGFLAALSLGIVYFIAPPDHATRLAPPATIL